MNDRTTATTYLITTPEKAIPSAGRRGLADDTILSEFGPLMWDAYSCFSVDPGYFEEMCQVANLIEYKREVWRKRKASQS